TVDPASDRPGFGQLEQIEAAREHHGSQDLRSINVQDRPVFRISFHDLGVLQPDVTAWTYEQRLVGGEGMGYLELTEFTLPILSLLPSPGASQCILDDPLQHGLGDGSRVARPSDRVGRFIGSAP